MTSLDKLAVPVLLVGGALLLVWFLRRGVGGVAADVGQATVSAAGGLAIGAAKGVGEVFGVPDTDTKKCSDAMREGRKLDASFACPAGTFLSWATSGFPSEADAAPSWREVTG